MFHFHKQYVFHFSFIVLHRIHFLVVFIQFGILQETFGLMTLQMQTVRIFSFFSFQFYWDVIATQHCLSLRCREYWFYWYPSWNDFHNKFSEHPSSHMHTKLKKEKKYFSLRWKLLGFIARIFSNSSPVASWGGGELWGFTLAHGRPWICVTGGWCCVSGSLAQAKFAGILTPFPLKSRMTCCLVSRSGLWVRKAWEARTVALGRQRQLWTS